MKTCDELGLCQYYFGKTPCAGCKARAVAFDRPASPARDAAPLPTYPFAPGTIQGPELPVVYLGDDAKPWLPLAVAELLAIALQLLPDLERSAITHRGRDWLVPAKVWLAGIDQMLALRDAGKLDLPMKGHGYLYAILVSLADKVEAVQEVQAEAAKRHPVTAATVTVRGAAMPMGQALQQVFGGLDPTLARLNAERGQATPMPEATRALLKTLKGPQP